ANHRRLIGQPSFTEPAESAVGGTDRPRRRDCGNRTEASSMNRRTKSRWPALPLNGRSASLLPHDHPAVIDGRTVYPTTVRAPLRRADAPSVLKSAVNSRKIGGEILKGRWRGLPAYTLTLEERATCPTTCRHWRSCYGNKMQWADRMQ